MNRVPDEWLKVAIAGEYDGGALAGCCVCNFSVESGAVPQREIANRGTTGRIGVDACSLSRDQLTRAAESERVQHSHWVARRPHRLLRDECSERARAAYAAETSDSAEATHGRSRAPGDTLEHSSET